MNIRPSSGEVVSPTSGESSARSIRRDHLSKDNRYQLAEYNSEGNNSDIMSLESIVIKRDSKNKVRDSNNSVEEAFTPNFITKRSSVGGNHQQELDLIYYKDGKHMIPYDYRPPLIMNVDSDVNHNYEEDEFSESMEGSELNFSSNREDMVEVKTEGNYDSKTSA